MVQIVMFDIAFYISLYSVKNPYFPYYPPETKIYIQKQNKYTYVIKKISYS